MGVRVAGYPLTSRYQSMPFRCDRFISARHIVGQPGVTYAFWFFYDNRNPTEKRCTQNQPGFLIDLRLLRASESWHDPDFSP